MRKLMIVTAAMLGIGLCQSPAAAANGTDPAVAITARANVGLSSEKGNTDTDKINLDADLAARTAHQRYNIGGEFNRELADDQETADNWIAYGNARHYFSSVWYGYGSAMYEHDAFSDLDLRQTYGAGAGYQFFESKNLNLSASAGLAQIYTDYTTSPDDDFPSVQWEVNYDQFLLDRAFQLFHRQTGYVGIEESNRWALKTRQGVRLPIYKGLTATLQYNYDYNNAPSPNAKEKWDSKIMFLLGYAFGE